MEIELISKTVKGGIARDKDGNPIKCPKEFLPLTDEELANTKFELIDVSGASEEDYKKLNDMLKAEIEKQTNASWEDIAIEETSSTLTPEETVKLAMETIIQVGNLWDDGVYELTPHMQGNLKNALSTLQNYPEKNSQIIALIKNGTYYLNSMNLIKTD